MYGNAIVADSGNSASSRELLDVIYAAMAQMSYDAVGFGIMEAALGDATAESAENAGIPFVGAMDAGTESASPGTATVTVGEHRVAIVSLGWVADPEDEQYVQAALTHLTEARENTGFVVLLSQLGRADDVAFLEREALRGLVDVVVGGPVKWPGAAPDLVGSTVLLPGSNKGREIGVLEVKLTDGGPRYHHELIRLAPELPEDEAVAKLVDEYYAARLEKPQGGVIGTNADQPPLPPVFSDDEARLIRGRGYLTADECGRCHDEQQAQWQGTDHAKALTTLVEANRTVRECLSCHSEANRRGMPYNPEGADQYGVDCSACHGAGLFHASTGGAQDTIVRTPGEMVCRRCHTAARDVEFSMDIRLPGVTH